MEFTPRRWLEHTQQEDSLDALMHLCALKHVHIICNMLKPGIYRLLLPLGAREWDVPLTPTPCGMHATGFSKAARLPHLGAWKD